MSTLLNIFHKLSGVVLTLTFVINYTLIYLTIFHAPNLFGTYRNFIVTFAVFGVVFSSLEFLIKPVSRQKNVLHISQSEFQILYLNSYSVVIFSTGFSILESYSLSTLMLSLFTGFHCSMLSLISIQFLYRYWSISSSVLIFESRRFAYWILGVIFGGFLWAVFTYNTISCDSSDKILLKYELEKSHDIDIGQCIKLILSPLLILYLPTFLLSYLPFTNFSTNGTIMPVLTVYPFIDSILVLNVISEYKIAMRNVLNRMFWCLGKEKQYETTPVTMNTLFSAI
ncbi:hypothetical protein CRE_16441 [Caenorhabditis remanei]|uniref:Uncharacterized protein n=1 Tax=Caenorhabditis remanei TaxID=31234 RepID=E3NF75_CAERE|nr:hypothetical protein CRE_16441 [Caenorhabditis remanei]